MFTHEPATPCCSASASSTKVKGGACYLLLLHLHRQNYNGLLPAALLQFHLRDSSGEALLPAAFSSLNTCCCCLPPVEPPKPGTHVIFFSYFFSSTLFSLFFFNHATPTADVYIFLHILVGPTMIFCLQRGQVMWISQVGPTNG